MQCPEQKPNGHQQPDLLSFSPRERHYPGNVGLTFFAVLPVQSCAREERKCDL